MHTHIHTQILLLLSPALNLPPVDLSSIKRNVCTISSFTFTPVLDRQTSIVREKQELIRLRSSALSTIRTLLPCETNHADRRCSRAQHSAHPVSWPSVCLLWRHHPNQSHEDEEHESSTTITQTTAPTTATTWSTSTHSVRPKANSH